MMIVVVASKCRHPTKILKMCRILFPLTRPYS